jgi:hypothetical protein
LMAITPLMPLLLIHARYIIIIDYYHYYYAIIIIDALFRWYHIIETLLYWLLFSLLMISHY